MLIPFIRHRPELEYIERLPVEARTRLAEQHGRPQLVLHRNSRARKDRGRNDKGH
jgi:hypothetical protein